MLCVFRMAPEVIACETSTEEPYTCSADIWSFGLSFCDSSVVHAQNQQMAQYSLWFIV